MAKSSKKKAPRALPSSSKISASAKSKKTISKKSPGKSTSKPVAKKPLPKKLAAKKAVVAKLNGKPVAKASAKVALNNAAKAKANKVITTKTAQAKPVARVSTNPVRVKPVVSKPVIKEPVLKEPVEKKLVVSPVNKVPVAAKPVPVVAKPALVVKPSRSLAPTAQKPEPFHAQPAVATNLKPRKSQIGLGVRELEHFADMLLAKRRELVGDMHSMEHEALRTGSGSNLSTLPVHMADMGTDNYEQEFTLGLVEKDRLLLREINHALAKIQNGTFGICEGTGNAIGKPRLEVQPWTRFSIEYARQREKNGRGVRTLS